MNSVNKIFGKGEIKRKEQLRSVIFYKDDHMKLKTLIKERRRA